MLIVLDKNKDSETEGILAEGSICLKNVIDEAGNEATSKSTNTTKFKGFLGFNSTYVYPILKAVCKKPDSVVPVSAASLTNFYSVTTYYRDETKYLRFEFTNCKHSTVIFNYLRSFGIILNTLVTVVYEDKINNTINLVIPPKLLNPLVKLKENESMAFVYVLWCILALTYSIYRTKINVYQDSMNDSCLNIDYKDFVNLEKCYNSFISSADTLRLQVVSSLPNPDDPYTSVLYGTRETSIIYNQLDKTGVSKFISGNFDNFTYNTITYDFDDLTETRLLLIDRRFEELEYYLLNLRTGWIITTNRLYAYNTISITEILPKLAMLLSKLNPKLTEIVVHYKPVEELFDTVGSVNISVDAKDYQEFLELIPNISENNNIKEIIKLYKNAKVSTDVTNVNLEEEYKDDEYAQELYKQVQEYYSSFDLKDLNKTIKGVATGEIYSMLFEGDSGTGKSTAARVIASRCGIPFISLNCSTNIEESDMFGAMIPNPEKNSVDDPEFIWQDGPAAKAIRNGYCLIIEEISFARPGILGKLNSLLDESRQIELGNGEVLKAHKNFRLIATCNIGYEGTNRLNKALINRFEICKKFVDIDKHEAVEIIKSRTGYSDDTKINKIYEIYSAIKKYSNEKNLNLIVSLRQLLNIFKQGKYYNNAEDAVNNLMVNQAFLEEPEHLEFFRDTILSVFDLKFKI